eukprot:TRINITY_DN1451_c0_g4_i3.p1 TRINITY_DN1451_c0_g4~~TRINITY_DN1451_c0_g4_i3.p1  ORF type:complete len:294 (+),score=46.31 TRINITY_DN1451_c0_g4_i3:531-1412(+)
MNDNMRRSKQQHTDSVTYRPLHSSDLPQLRYLHNQLFPVTYTSSFYSKLFEKNYYCIVATISTSNLPSSSTTSTTFLESNGISSTNSMDIGVNGSDNNITEVSISETNPILNNEESPSNGNETLIGVASGVVNGYPDEDECFGDTYCCGRPPYYCCDWILGSEIAGYIMTLGVDARFRGQGIGGQLLERLCKIFVSCDCTYFFLHVKVDNDQAIQFYASHNFKSEKLLHNYYDIDNKNYNAFRLVRREKEKNLGVCIVFWKDILFKLFNCFYGVFYKKKSRDENNSLVVDAVV